MRVTEKRPYRVLLDNDREYYELEDSNFGLCVKCGADHYHCEPDAAEYVCDDCGENAVYGMMHLLMNNRVVMAPEV